MNHQLCRASWHDYRQPAIYHITLTKPEETCPYGKLILSGHPYISYSTLGHSIKQAIQWFKNNKDFLKIYRHAIMPDHLHMLWHITRPIDCHLGHVVAEFKHTVNHLAVSQGALDYPLKKTFNPGFNDKIIGRQRNLNVVYSYIETNALRLAARKLNPNFFSRQLHLNIAGVSCNLYGNLQLLDYPFKNSIVIHRNTPSMEKEEFKQRILYYSYGGGVAVGAFISPEEKSLLKDIKDCGGRIILLTNMQITDRFKPSGELFHLCHQGRLLLISPEVIMQKAEDKLSRETCLYLNAMAEKIAGIVNIC